MGSIEHFSTVAQTATDTLANIHPSQNGSLGPEIAEAARPVGHSAFGNLLQRPSDLPYALGAMMTVGLSDRLGRFREYMQRRRRPYNQMLVGTPNEEGEVIIEPVNIGRNGATAVEVVEVNEDRRWTSGRILGGLAVLGAGLLGGYLTAKYAVEPHFHNSADLGALFKHGELPHHHGRLQPFTEHFDGSPHGVWSQAAPSPTPTPNVNPVTPTHDQVINALTGKDRPTSGPWTNTVYPKFDSPNVSGEHTMALSTHHEGRSLTDWYQGDAGLSRHRTVDGVGVDRLDEVAKATGLKIDKNHADYQSMIDDFRGRLQRLGDITNSEARQLRVGKIIPTFSDRETFSFLNLDKYSDVVDTSHAAKITNLNTVLGPEHAVLDLGTVSQHTPSTLGHTSLAGLENSKGHLELGGYSVGLSPTEAGANAHTGWGAVSDYLSQYAAELPHANLEFQDHITRLTAEANNVSIGERRPGYILDTELPVGFRWFLPSREQLMAEYHAWWQQTEEVRRLAQKDLALAS